MVKIFVGGLNPDVTEMDLAILVSIHGQVITIKIVRDKVTHKSKGYAFIEMANQQGAERAVEELNDTRFNGNVLTVRLADAEPPKTAQRRQGPPRQGGPASYGARKPYAGSKPDAAPRRPYDGPPSEPGAPRKPRKY